METPCRAVNKQGFILLCVLGGSSVIPLLSSIQSWLCKARPGTAEHGEQSAEANLLVSHCNPHCARGREPGVHGTQL